VKLFDKTLTTLSQSLDARLLRQNALAGNLANANTPGYKPVDVSFEAAMAESAGSLAAPGTPEVTSPEGFLPLGGERAPLVAGHAVGKSGATAPAAPGIDGNAVDLDRTMVALAQNALQYGASARAAQKKLSILRYVASDGNA